MTLQALREKVGDDVFFTILRSWYAENRNGNVTTADFIALAERVSGRQLDEFFQRLALRGGQAGKLVMHKPNGPQGPSGGRCARDPRAVGAGHARTDVLDHEGRCVDGDRGRAQPRAARLRRAGGALLAGVRRVRGEDVAVAVDELEACRGSRSSAGARRPGCLRATGVALHAAPSTRPASDLSRRHRGAAAADFSEALPQAVRPQRRHHAAHGQRIRLLRIVSSPPSGVAIRARTPARRAPPGARGSAARVEQRVQAQSVDQREQPLGDVRARPRRRRSARAPAPPPRAR